MILTSSSGSSFISKSAEELVPYKKWITWLKKIAVKCVKTNHLPVKVGYKYSAYDFWEILIQQAFENLGLDETSDRYNQLLYDIKNSHQRHKKSPKKFNDKRDRKARLCPNGDNVRKYRNSLPDYLIKQLNWIIFKSQIEYAKEEELIDQEIDLIVDNSNQWYYGKDRYQENLSITKGYNGPGTSRKRNYLGIMIKSSSTYLYCGADVIKKKHSNIPFILKTCDKLLQMGFKIRYLIADRWFPTMELLLALPSLKIDYIGPYKKYAPIKRIIKEYIKNGGEYIHYYNIKGSPKKYYCQNKKYG